MATENRTGGATAALDSKTADKLLDLLGTDDAFRALFSSDPMKALAQVGHVAGAEPADAAAPTLQACCKVRALASKEDIRKSRAEINRMLTSGLSQTTPYLDAGLSEAERRLK